MQERKKGTLKSGRSGKKVKSREQAIAIGLSEARRAGAQDPPQKYSSKKKYTQNTIRIPPPNEQPGDPLSARSVPATEPVGYNQSLGRSFTYMRQEDPFTSFDR